MKNIKNKRLRGEIAVICEGQTEKDYINNLIKGNRKVKVFNICGGGYKSITERLPKYKNRFEILLVICDLDRAFTSNTELNNLNRLIVELQRIDKRNNIFLTYENIEFWFACCLGDKNINVKNMKGYKKGGDIIKFLEEHDGDFEKGKELLRNEDVSKYYFYKKEPLKKEFPRKQDVVHKQSTMWYFLDYIKNLQS